MKNNHPNRMEIQAFVGSLKELKTIMTDEWKQRDEESLECLQEEIDDINDAIKRLLRKQHD